MALRITHIIFWLIILLLTAEITSSSTESPNTCYNPAADPSNNRPASEAEDGNCETVAARWTENRIVQVAELWGLDAKDQEKLRQLGNSISDVDHWKNDPFEVIRYLIQFDMDLEYCEGLIRDTVKWRIKHDMDTFLERYQQPPVFHYVPFLLMRGLDKDNDPILIQRLGKLDALGLYKREGAEAMIDANCFLTELISTRGNGIPKELDWQRNYYEPLAGRRFKHFTSVVDLDGLSARNIRPSLMRILQKSATIGQYHYPGLAKRTFIIRAPKVFRMAWSVAKHFYDKQTLAKLVIVTEDNYLDVLKEYMDLEHLPPAINPINGKGQPMPGYYENIHLEGGLPPAEPTTQA